MGDLLTVEEVADLTRSSVSTVRHWHHHGTGPRSFKIGRRRFWARSDVDEWLEQQRQGEPPAAR